MEEGSEAVAQGAEDEGAAHEVGLAVVPTTVPKAEVVEVVEQALHAFGVGRLDIAFEVLRDLLAGLKAK